MIIKMAGWIKRLLGLEPPHLVYPFRGLIQAMRDKDPELYKEVGPMIPSQAWRRWIEVYPEDFPLRGMDIPNAACIKPINRTDDWLRSVGKAYLAVAASYGKFSYLTALQSALDGRTLEDRRADINRRIAAHIQSLGYDR